MIKNETPIKNPQIAEVVTALTEVYDLTVVPFAGHYRLILADIGPDALKLEIRGSGRTGAYLRVWASGGPTGQQANSQYDSFYSQCSTPEQWRSPEDLGKGMCPDTKVQTDTDTLLDLAVELIEWCLDNVAATVVAPAGATFENTNFAGYGERDFMAAVIFAQKSGYVSVIPSVGSNLGFEHVVPSTNSRIDAVEFNENGEVITVIECQSGIQNGNYLDDEHFAKAISRYPQSVEVRNTVRQIVVIAGGYSEGQLATFGQLPYEIVALITKVENGQIVLEKVN